MEDCSERAAYLLAELSYGKPERIEARARQAMLSEHHRLKEALSAVEAAIGGARDDRGAGAGRGARRRRREPAARGGGARGGQSPSAPPPRLLLDADPRSEITLLAQEWDRQRPLDRWLGGLIEVLGDLGWQLIAHVHRDPAPAPADWPRSGPTARRAPRRRSPSASRGPSAIP
ncbi:MAG: hypothetical protein M5U28_29305 [Sandaracinaceae bacterium]|nr:hypothetical protein [Sandaracinaceae bacterium]